MNKEEIRKIVLEYLKEKMTIEIQPYEGGDFAVRVFLDGWLIDSDYTHIKKEKT